MFEKIKDKIIVIFSTIWRWMKRAFMGPQKELSALEEEAITSPLKVTVKKFFKNKLAIVGLTIFIGIFLFCFVGSWTVNSSDTYFDNSQKNTGPGLSLLSVPSDLKKNGIKDIAIGSTYSIGIDNKGKLYAWGSDLSSIVEGYYKETVQGRSVYYRVGYDSFEYEEISLRDILTIKESFKKLNKNNNLVAEKVFAGYDSFFVVFNDNSVRGYGFMNDSESFANNIVYNFPLNPLMPNLGKSTMYEDVKENGVKSISSFNQITSLITDGENPQIYVWGSTLRLNVTTDSFKEEVETYGLTLLEQGWSQDAIAVLGVDQDGKYRIMTRGSSTGAINGNNPSSLIATYQSEISSINTYDIPRLLLADATYQELIEDYNQQLAAKRVELAGTTDPNERLVIQGEITRINGLIDSEKADYLETTTNQDILSRLARIETLESNIETCEEQLTTIANNFKDMIVTNGSVVILLNDGTIMGWGDNQSGELTLPEEYAGKLVSLEGTPQASTNYSHIVGILDDGSLAFWGNGFRNVFNCDKDLLNGSVKVSKVYNSFFQNIAVDEDGKLLDTWGFKGYIFGSDSQGRPIFDRIITGGRVTLTIGIIAVIISGTIGIIIGGIAGYYGGKVDTLLMRLCEIVGSIPFMPIAMTLSIVFTELGYKDTNSRMMIIMVILGILSWPGLAQLIRAHILAEREKEFVTAAKALGVKSSKIIFKHIIPNIITIIIINITFSYASSLLTESGLSFLGFGIQEPNASWGNMLTGAQDLYVIRNYWWRWVFPSLFLCAVTISVNLIGDCIRDAVDPRSTER